MLSTTIPSPPESTIRSGKENDQLPRLIPRTKKNNSKNSLPVLETSYLSPPPDLSTLTFTEPSHRILSQKDHELFQASSTYSLIVSFVFSISESVVGKKLTSISLSSTPPVIHTILSILSSIEDTISSYPPADQGSSRFGNPTFRLFLDSLRFQSTSWHGALGLNSPSCVTEVSTYLLNSFGNHARIDYGSGHELNFIIWLLCLNRLSLLPESTFPALGLLVFPRYLTVLRRLQTTYYLEPAGSHGVWGLDDYHFLPFLFGASQLLHHPYIRPLSIHNEVILEEEGDEYLYLTMVRWTMASKSVKGLRWTQPMLDDISGAKSWEKVEQGMRRMFVREVLGKLPVMQHFLFGSLVPAIVEMGSDQDAGLAAGEGKLEEREPKAEPVRLKHVHNDDTLGDCCGIKVPSTAVAAQEARKRGDRGGLRRVPFD